LWEALSGAGYVGVTELVEPLGEPGCGWDHLFGGSFCAVGWLGFFYRG
jgi:hypothetical protein